MALAKTELASTGMRITRVGFGAWAIGGTGYAFAWGHQDDDESIAAIRHAVERGVNWIDTAAVYGLGHSEEVVAAALEPIPERDRPYVFTKGGLVWTEAERASGNAKPRRDGSQLRREVEDSLRRLRTDRIDLYQMHWPAEDGTALDEYWQTLLDLKAEGKIRAAGLSNHSVEQLTAADKLGHVDTLQPPFNAVHRAAAAELAWCDEHGTGVIMYSPMASGLLTGAFSAQRVAALPSDDWRARSADFTTGLPGALRIVDALRAVAERHGVSVPAAAVAWTLAWRGATAAIVGARRPGQVDDWLPAADLRLDDSDLASMATAITESGTGEGPAHPWP